MSTVRTEEDKISMEHLFTDKYYKLVELSKEYVLYLISDILKKSNIHPFLESDYVAIEKIIHDLGFIPQSNTPISWMFRYLVKFELLQEKQVEGVPCFRLSGVISEMDPDAITRKMLEIDINVLSSNLLLEKAARGYPDFLLGKRTAVDILFNEDKMKLWNEYFSNSNSGYVVHNALAASGLLKCLPDRPGLKILEVGGGTGNAAVYFLKEMQGRGLIDNIEEYIFSDISPVLLRSGNHTIMRELDDIQMVQLKTLDFERSFVSQGIEPDSLDVVFGVNSIHAAKDLMGALDNIYKALKPGGSIILSECARQDRSSLLFQELIFNLFDNYRNVTLSDLRPMPGFLDVESWKKLLIEAKFKEIEFLSNIDFDCKKNNTYNKEIIAMVVIGDKV